MLKKTFYTMLALGAIITIGVLSSGFTGTTGTNTTTVESERPFAGKWIAGAVNDDGTVRDNGTGDWTVTKNGYVFEVQGPANAKILVATSINTHETWMSPTTYTTYVNVESMGNGRFRVKLLRPDKYAMDSVLLGDSGFSFVMYVQ